MGAEGFITAPNIIVPLNDFSTSLTLKEDSENDTSGTNPTNTRGRELRPISFSSIYVAAAGVKQEPSRRMGVLAWQAYPLYIGDKRFGPAKMKLTKVDTSEVQLTVSGVWISCKITLTMEEYSEGKTSALISGKKPLDPAHPQAAKRKRMTTRQHLQQKNKP